MNRLTKLIVLGGSILLLIVSLTFVYASKDKPSSATQPGDMNAKAEAAGPSSLTGKETS